MNKQVVLSFFRPRVRLVLVASFFLIASCLAWQVAKQWKALKWVDHTDLVIRSDQALLKLNLDAETGLRGYLLTGESSFLEPYNTAVAKSDVQFEVLYRLLTDNPSQQIRVMAIKRKYSEWLSSNKPAQFDRSSVGSGVAVQGLIRGKMTMDELRTDHEILLSTEMSLRRQREIAVAAHSAIVGGLFIVLFLLAGAIAIGTFREQQESLQNKADHILITERLLRDQERLLNLSALEKLLREKRIEALSHMAGGLAHEINNPLAIIHAEASGLQDRANVEQAISGSDIRAACESILRTTDRAVAILRGLKGFARGGTQDPLELASVYQIVEQCVNLKISVLKQHQIEIRLALMPGIPDLFCREIQIEQILTNLLNNAVDAIVQSDSLERWIFITASSLGASLQIEVSDSGPGIEDHFKDHLMEPFFTTKGGDLSTGIGLSLSRIIAEDHGGTLNLVKDAEHATFRLILPLTQETFEFKSVLAVSAE